MIPAFTFFFEKQALFEPLIKPQPNNRLMLIVIIPAINEPKILNTLNSLKKCTNAPYPTEVIILVNNSNLASDNIKIQNQNTVTEINNWSKINSSDSLMFHCVFTPNLPVKHSGAGLARKIAMDEACRRFNSINNPNGIIASLDADTLVSENYLKDIQNSFNKDKKLHCGIFSFEHNLSVTLSKENKKAVVLYELYLRYFKLALHYTGFPYAFHTIGSCFCISAQTYIKQGGMNRKQAGEDFYFLHKIFPLGGTKELNHITVYPSARISDRVPFGTGPAIRKIINDGNFLTYQFEYFEYLKAFFTKIDLFFNADLKELEIQYLTLHGSIKNHISFKEFKRKIEEIKQNSASILNFRKRFYNWFDAFQIIKYLNNAHITNKKTPITEVATKLIHTLNGIHYNNLNTNTLLKILRELDYKISN